MIGEKFASIERRSVLFALIILVASVFLFRLAQLQIINKAKFEERSSDNSIKPVTETPLRGLFFDRNGKIIVDNIPAYTIRITPAKYDTSNNMLLESSFELEPGFVNNLLHKNKNYSQHVPVKIKRGVSVESIAWLEENSEYLPGVDYIIEMQRNYIEGIMPSHIYGYSKEVGQAQIKSDNYYASGDVIGFNGIEKYYEEKLRGVKGYNFIVVDSKGKEISKFNSGFQDIPSKKGSDLILGIDANVQRAAELDFVGKSGAAVAIDPKTGEIIAMVSAPNYDLNQFSYQTSREYLSKLYADPLKPQFNRATMSAHPPGSTFKLISSIAALDLGVINPAFTYYCGGGFTFGRFFKCHGADGSLNVIHAIERSCNTFFYQLIFRVGLNNLADYANRFKLGIKTGVDIAEESGGLIPRESYYEKVYGKNWPRGILVSLGIGQGEISVTPLQLAFFAALIANDGVSYTPHLVKGFYDKNRNLVELNFPKVDTKVKKEVFEIVKEGMRLVVQGNGTATRIRTPDYEIAGKTGTAQNPHGKDHAWFMGFAPFNDPQIAVAVMVENVGFGSTHAAPIAKKMLDEYLLPKIKKKEIKKSITSNLLPVN